MEMIEIKVIAPKKLSIYVPQQLFDEFERVVDEKSLSTIIIEAITDELTKIRFRKEFEKTNSIKQTRPAGRSRKAAEDSARI